MGSLSIHGLVLLYLAKNNDNTVQVIAQEMGLSIRGVQNIIEDPVSAGYLGKQKIGRGIHYTINPGIPLRHYLTRDYKASIILHALGWKKPE